MSYIFLDKHNIGPVEMARIFKFKAVKDFFDSPDYLWLNETYDRALQIKESNPRSFSKEELLLQDWHTKNFNNKARTTSEL